MAPNNSVAADVVCVASWNADLISHIARPLGRGETLMGSGFAISPGGKGSNAAIAASRMGAHVGLIARVGGDDFGQMGFDLWHQEGIHTAHVVRGENEVNGTALIFVFSTLLKTDERRSSVTLWDWPANPKPHISPICPGRAVGVEHRLPAFQLEQLTLSESLIGRHP